MSKSGSHGDLRPLDRLRALGFFTIAIVYFLFAQALSASAARGLTSGAARDLLSRTLLLFLLLIGYAGMGYAFQTQTEPLKAMGLVRRQGWGREFGLGLALGWGMVLACVLPIAITGGLVVTLWTTPRQFGLLPLNLAVLAIASLAEEVAFRGYPFQRLIEAIGPTTATLLMAVMFGLVHLSNPGATSASALVTVLSGVLLATAYLRTRALWLPWGFHAGWNAVMAILFGLPVSGLNFSAVIESNPVGPVWLTGGGYGPEGSLTAVVVLAVGLAVLVRMTRGYAWKYAQPVIVPGGIPVDIDTAAARAHEAAAAHATEPPASKLIQIAPTATNSPAASPDSHGFDPQDSQGKIEAEPPSETEPLS